MMEQSVKSFSEIAGAIGRGILDIRRGAVEVGRGVSEVVDRASREEARVVRAVRKTGRSMRHTTKVIGRSGERVFNDAERYVWRPAEKSLNEFVRDVTNKRRKRFPTWAKFALGGLGVGVAAYGLSRTSTVQKISRPLTEPLGDMIDAAGETLNTLTAEL